jgi:hypothetical protein
VKRAVLLIAVLGLSACGGSGYTGPVVVHASIALRSSFATLTACRGTGALSEYEPGGRLLVEDQDSRPVSSAVLIQGVPVRGDCEFRFTVTLPKGDRSLWLPMSELGIAACRSTHRGAVIFDRSTTGAHAINASLGLPAGDAGTAAGHCEQ